MNFDIALNNSLLKNLTTGVHDIPKLHEFQLPRHPTRVPNKKRTVSTKGEGLLRRSTYQKFEDQVTRLKVTVLLTPMPYTL